jgi:uncharacterized protein (TIGR00369 family)
VWLSLTDDAEQNAADSTPVFAIPVHDRMGMKILQHGPRAVVTMELTEEVRGAFEGSVHGGMLATLADVACALAAAGTYDSEEEVPVTTDLHVRYYRQPLSGPLTATATLVHSGRRLMTSECSIVDDQNRELARATATFMLVPRS